MQQAAESQAASVTESWPFDISQPTPSIGAEITGVDLREPLDDATYLALRRALVKYKVLFFRRQDITPAQHVAFARRFGELEVHPVFKHHPDHPELVQFDKSADNRGRENIYHSDVSWRQIPSMGSILRCVECPRTGGDTIWVNMAMAYANLPDEVKARIANLQAVHDILPTFSRAIEPEQRESIRKEFPPATHPVVRTHPESGEKILYINEAFVTHLANYSQLMGHRIGSDFRLGELDLLQYLYRQAAAPEYQVRLKWEPNTIAFWDNRSTHHYAIQDYYPAVRRMMRATVIGDLPF
ncbi:TauD/TfdA dioxygenase family protein [Cupriavidus taiwanensis]|uniref:Alpha-ketoglutarate-dependent taurine dioxygenase n=1 Tax=Cupriavidus taiwanensis TaxID=164546 RepID=A0A7Z7JFA2_9BURK|nr:TauD/TfdA family dioxygenase [Cupriavidus taiwanensis]SOZ17127.1 Alpha-ketoglutarate-dependent taurine dioxygenase [Cupriavidus taiwanensis]SOZ96220.1 Alpha-ketoglutarate-dependent taurine dioxygenase [Cupriavidus taiwanensis]SPC25511.1 Alpha-ketoglutarate-dependent taurine dioxygenase [Cupriavidus taiwanensis]